MRTHSEEEAFRATLAAHTLDGQRHTLIVTRRNTSNPARVWLTLHGAWKTTVQLTDPEATQLTALLTQALHASGSPQDPPGSSG